MCVKHPEDCAVDRRDRPREECKKSLAGNSAAGGDVSPCKHICSIKEETSQK